MNYKSFFLKKKKKLGKAAWVGRLGTKRRLLESLAQRSLGAWSCMVHTGLEMF